MEPAELDCDDWSGPPLPIPPYRVQTVQPDNGAGRAVDATLTVRSNDPDGG